MLVESHHSRPRIEPLAPLELKVPIERGVEPAGGTAKVAAHVLEVDVPLASPKDSTPEAFGVAEAFAHTGQRLGERLTTWLAPEATLLDEQPDLVAPKRLVSKMDGATVVAGNRACSASGAVLLLAPLLGDDLDAAVAWKRPE